jgi:HK97 family phage major capsid protein
MAGIGLAEEIASFSDEDTREVLKMLRERKAAGDGVHMPGSRFGTATSSRGGLAGANALNPDINKSGNMAYFEQYNDPSLRMNAEKRSALLAKSLFDVGYKGRVPFRSFGDFIRKGYAGDTEFRGMHKSCFDGIPADFFRARGMSGVTGEDGGFLITPEFSNTIETLFFENDLPTRIDTMPISGTHFRWPRARDTSRADGSRHAGALGYWIDEGDTLPESKLKIGFSDMRMKKLCVVVFMTTEIMNDTDYAIEQWVRNAVREEANFQISRAIMLGAGGPEPIGYTTKPACVTVAKTVGQAADTITVANLLQMESQLFRTAGSSPIWLSHVSTIPQVGQLNIGNFPVNINIMNGGFSLPPQKQLRGLPQIDSEFCSTLGDLGDIHLIDPKMIKAIRRSLVREDVSAHVEFLTDQNCLRFIFGFDSRPLYDDPITPFQAGATAPPSQASFLRLAERAQG